MASQPSYSSLQVNGYFPLYEAVFALLFTKLCRRCTHHSRLSTPLFQRPSSRLSHGLSYSRLLHLVFISQRAPFPRASTEHWHVAFPQPSEADRPGHWALGCTRSKSFGRFWYRHHVLQPWCLFMTIYYCGAIQSNNVGPWDCETRDALPIWTCHFMLRVLSSIHPIVSYLRQ